MKIHQRLSLLLLPGYLWVTGCGSSNAGPGDTKKEPEAIVYIKTEKIIAKPFAETIRLTGTVESVDNIIVPAEEGGRILRWLATKGATVQRGQAIAQIDDAAYRSAYDAAQAAYQMAEVNYQKQKSAFAEQAISELQLKNLEFQRDAAKAQADLAKQRLDKTTVTSPVNGVLNEQFADAGEMAAPGMPIAQIIDMTNLKVMVGVPERYARDVQPNLSVEFTADAFPGETFRGKIGFVGAAVNPDNRTIPVELFLTNPGGKLKPQMIASVAMKLAAIEKAILIQRDFVQQVDAGRLVVYVHKDGIAEERAVRIGGMSRGFVHILSGLQEGDEVITVGYQNLTPQQAVRIQP
ncbi:MAG TPA: efflux RND transporter periplasmic adaptor subunit [bacterium]|nr:efflux RND transporter periplasmic adaptor subunit [bacterium]